jgi:hypothetical protein
MEYQSFTMCYSCKSKMNNIGAVTGCTICLMKRLCAMHDCPNPVYEASRYCKQCDRIEYLCREIKDLREIIKIYEKEDEERRNHQSKCQDQNAGLDGSL